MQPEAAQLPRGTNMKNALLWVKAWFKQWARWKDYKAMRRKVSKIDTFLAISRILTGNPPVSSPGPFIAHPAQQEAIDSLKANLRTVKKIETVAYGDSLMDFPRFALQSVPSGQNAAKAGMWAHQIRGVILATAEVVRERKPDYVILSSGAGNPLLAYQPIESVISQTLELLNTARKEFPQSKLIVYGLPPTSRMYLLQNSQLVEQVVFNWILKDGNAVFLPLQKQFAGMLGIFPKARISSDKVHFTPLGVRIFDELLQKAKKAGSGSIVD